MHEGGAGATINRVSGTPEKRLCAAAGKQNFPAKRDACCTNAAMKSVTFAEISKLNI